MPTPSNDYWNDAKLWAALRSVTHARVVVAGVYFNAEKNAVETAEAGNVGPAIVARRIFAPALIVLVVNVGSVLALDSEAM